MRSDYLHTRSDVKCECGGGPSGCWILLVFPLLVVAWMLFGIFLAGSCAADPPDKKDGHDGVAGIANIIRVWREASEMAEEPLDKWEEKK